MSDEVQGEYERLRNRFVRYRVVQWGAVFASWFFCLVGVARSLKWMEPPEPDVPLWMAIAGILGLIAIAAGGLLLLLMRRVGFRTLETAFAVLGAWMVLPPLIGAYYGLIQILEGSEFTR